MKSHNSACPYTIIVWSFICIMFNILKAKIQNWGKCIFVPTVHNMTSVGCQMKCQMKIQAPSLYHCIVHPPVYLPQMKCFTHCAKNKNARENCNFLCLCDMEMLKHVKAWAVAEVPRYPWRTGGEVHRSISSGKKQCQVCKCTCMWCTTDAVDVGDISYFCSNGYFDTA